MPPKEKITTRDESRKLGISFDWKPFGSGDPGDVEVTKANSHLEETGSQIEEADLPEVIAQPGNQPAENNSEGEALAIEDDLEWDHSEDTRTPPKDTSDFLDISQNENLDESISVNSESDCRELVPFRNWSLVNLFNREANEAGVFSPEAQTSRHRLGGLASPALDRIEEVDRNDDQNYSVGDVFEDINDEIRNMDEQAYRQRCFTIGDALRDVEDAIADFGPDQVHSRNLEHCEDTLISVKRTYVDFRTTLRRFYSEFDRVEHNTWELEWEQKLETLRLKYTANEKEIREKVEMFKNKEKEDEENLSEREALKAAAEAAKQAIETKEKKSIVAKARIEREDIFDKLKELKSKIAEKGSIVKLEDFKICEFLKESVRWSTTMADLEKRKVELKKLVVLYPFSTLEEANLDEYCWDVTNEGNESVELLKTEESKRKLYTNARNQSKDSVPYPVYKSKDDEDVLKFMREMKDAFVRNQVPLKDHVKHLRLQLRGLALEIVHKDLTDIDEAYKLLTRQFGSSDQIWAAKYKVFLQECEKKWPSTQGNARERFQKLTRIIVQIDDLERFIEERTMSKAELFNAGNVKKFLSLMPEEIFNDTLETI